MSGKSRFDRKEELAHRFAQHREPGALVVSLGAAGALVLAEESLVPVHAPELPAKSITMRGGRWGYITNWMEEDPVLVQLACCPARRGGPARRTGPGPGRPGPRSWVPYLNN